MLVKISLGRKEDLLPKFEKFSEEDQNWLLDTEWERGKNCLKMPYEDVIRLLRMFNGVEEIYFEVR